MKYTEKIFVQEFKQRNILTDVERQPSQPVNKTNTKQISAIDQQRANAGGHSIESEIQ